MVVQIEVACRVPEMFTEFLRLTARYENRRVDPETQTRMATANLPEDCHIIDGEIMDSCVFKTFSFR